MTIPSCRCDGRLFLCGLLSVFLLAGCAARTPPATIASIPEIRPGVLSGYLDAADHPNSLNLLPPPPVRRSAAFALDAAFSSRSLDLQGTPRWRQAALDAALSFPEAAGAFSCALGIPVTEQQTPHLYLLLRRVLADSGLSTYTAKDHYRRARPFTINRAPICTPDDAAHLREDGSYPSGHTAVGWAWALILSEIAPERGDALIARGLAFGESRIVCNVHWHSDVVAGRFIGAATVARLHSDPEFTKAVASAKKEYATVRGNGLKPVRDCGAEAAALKDDPLQFP